MQRFFIENAPKVDVQGLKGCFGSEEVKYWM
jgi:hypothetical protein